MCTMSMSENNDEHKSKQKLFQMKFSYLNEPKKRTRTTPEQVEILAKAFEKNSLPTPKQRKVIAEQTGMSTRAIQVWFQNKRAKLRTKQKSRPKSSKSLKKNSSKIKQEKEAEHEVNVEEGQEQEQEQEQEREQEQEQEQELLEQVKVEVETETDIENMIDEDEFLQIDESEFSDSHERNETSPFSSSVSSPTSESTETREADSDYVDNSTSLFPIKLESEEIFELEEKYYYTDIKHEHDDCLLSPLQFYSQKKEFVC